MSAMKTTTLAGKAVGRIGYGLMQLTWVPKPVPDEESFAAMKAAADAGSTAWSTAMFYGGMPGVNAQSANVELIGRFFKKYPEYKDKITIVCKGGQDEQVHPKFDIDFFRAEVKKYTEAVGKRPDVWSLARLPPKVPVEDVFKALKQLKDEGLIGEVGASETSAESLKKAMEIVPIAVLEIEVSLWSYGPDIQAALALCAANHIPVFCYSPLGRGFMTRKWKTPDDIPDGSFQKMLPRFQGEAFYENLKLVDQLDALAQAKGVTTGQLALAWIVGLNDYTIPIPGSSRPERVAENAKAANITLTPSEQKEISDTLAKFPAQGDRYMGGLHQLSMQ